MRAGYALRAGPPGRRSAPSARGHPRWCAVFVVARALFLWSGMGGDRFARLSFLKERRTFKNCGAIFCDFFVIISHVAKVSYINIPPGMEEAYKKGLQPGDRFTFSRTRVKDLFLSRARVKGITTKSLLVTLSPVWQGFTPAEQAAWSSAGLFAGLSGFKAFVHDTAARMKAGHAGYATPNDIYQALVGRVQVESPATGLLLEQAHPLMYYVQRKVTGTRSQYSPVAVNEPFGFPLSLSISYKTSLTPIDSDARARFFAVVYSSYQGRTLEKIVSVDFPMSQDWTRASATLSGVLGPIQGYSAFIEVHNATGNLYFDNVSISHSSENWARDSICNNVSQAFTKAFFQVARHWVAVNPSEGADFGSFYFV